MKTFSIPCTVQELTKSELSPADLALVEAACSASESSYSPYSKFMVGAAVLLDNGEVVKGSNQENVSYPEGTCAERCAVFAAGATYPRHSITSIAIAAQNEVGFTPNPITPCGACRQVLIEAEHRAGHAIRVILYGRSKVYIINSVESLLPLQFTL